jgi:hypothetical protein
MNIPEYIHKKGLYYLHKKYGLPKSSLSGWLNKPPGWKPSVTVRLAFERIQEIEGDNTNQNEKPN